MLSFESWCSGKRPWKSVMKSRAFLFVSLLRKLARCYLIGEFLAEVKDEALMRAVRNTHPTASWRHAHLSLPEL
jgi:hypothetical protein